MKKINFAGIPIEFSAGERLDVGIGGGERHTPTVCMAGLELIFGFDDSNGNKGWQSTIRAMTAPAVLLRMEMNTGDKALKASARAGRNGLWRQNEGVDRGSSAGRSGVVDGSFTGRTGGFSMEKCLFCSDPRDRSDFFTSPGGQGRDLRESHD